MSNVENKNELAVSIRAMTLADVDAIAELERKVFPDPWPRSSFAEIPGDEQWGAIVAEYGGEIIGYACYLIVLQESHLTNIAVAESHRRKSVAKQLLQRILDIVIENKCELVLLEVRPSNHQAIAFYDKYGFHQLYRRPNYYRRPAEDALVMVRYLDID